METPGKWSCKYCGRMNFSSQVALRSHLRTSQCALRRESHMAAQNPGQSTLFAPESTTQANMEPTPNEDENNAFVAPFSPPEPPQKVSTSRHTLLEIEEDDVNRIRIEMAGLLDENIGSDEENASEDSQSRASSSGILGGNDENNEDDEDNSDEGSLEPGANSTDSDENSTESVHRPPDRWIRSQFKKYCEKAKHFRGFTEDEKRTIKLLHLLRDKNAPMNAYEPLMLWHLHESKKLYPQQTLGDYQGFIGRKTMIQRLINRYNYRKKLPKLKTIQLPVSGTIVNLTIHDAKATIQRLLTDPRIKATDYMFWEARNPLAAPPEKLDYIKDLNTGKAFTDTYARIIDQEKREQLLPVVIYFDGTAVSHFHDMEIIQVNIALGNMNRQARNQGYCWAPLGYVEKIHEQGGKGAEILAQANHMESQDARTTVHGTKTIHVHEGVGDKTDQDFHAMMDCILEEFVDLQDTGFLWDHHDPVSGEDTPDIHYKIFVPFLKVDGKEGDLACAKYAQRSSAQQICRKCHIPLQEADDHLAKYPLKTMSEIKALVDAADLDELRALSQTYLRNAFYKVRFSLGNDYGVHGSCPSELLHAFLLGTFKYLRDIFFEYIGKTSEGAKYINALSMLYGKLFCRQSDRTMPVTGFTKGIQVGKLMAKDYRGVLLVMLAILRCSKGREILKKHRNFKDKYETALDDWILLVETMLEWEAYLTEPVMQVKHVKRLEKKHRYIMYLMRKIAQRTAGMGLKLLKFHTILHIWEDIIQFGVPLEYDTSPNESMHKPSKLASKMTQKAADTFNYQTAQRLAEFLLLDLAVLEIDHGKVPWNFFDRQEAQEEEAPPPAHEVWTGDAQIRVFWHEKDKKRACEFTHSKSKFCEETIWNPDLTDFLFGLQEKVSSCTDTKNLPIFTCHQRNGQIFRAHPNYRGKGPWRDWAWVEWTGYGRLPSHIWCFVSLENMPSGRNSVEYGGISLQDGVFAVCETAELEEDEDEIGRSSLFMPILKEVEMSEDGTIGKKKLYLADTEAFSDPCCVVPDLGGPPNRYFVVQPRNAWSKAFVRWIQDEHRLDEMDFLDNVDEVIDEMEMDRPPRKKRRRNRAEK